MSASHKLPAVPGGEIVFYQTPDGQTRVECRVTTSAKDNFQSGVGTICVPFRHSPHAGGLRQSLCFLKYRLTSGPSEANL